jgi:hypothetical protein
MDESIMEIPTITIEPAKLKPIRCKGKTVPFMSEFSPERRKTICQGTVIGWTDGQVFFVNTENNMALCVAGERWITSKDGRRKEVFPKPITVQYVVGGKTYSLVSYVIGGRSISVFCGECGSVRKMVAMKFATYDKKILDSKYFKA